MSTYFTKTVNERETTRPFNILVAMLLVAAMAFVSATPVAARGAPGSFADLVEGLQPAVVNISTVQKIKKRERRKGERKVMPEGSPFGDFFDQFRDRFEEDHEPREARSLGSGFIVDATGIVVTNNHVIEEADEITVTLKDGEEYPAEVIGRDELSDVAVLQITHDNGDDFPFVKWGDSDVGRIGDWVVTIGNPFGLGGSVTAGIISARNRSINRTSDVEFIQSDAPINRGNSGGPMFNMDGNVIGVNTAIFSPTGGNVGIGFAIPANDAKRVVSELREHGKVRRGWLGVGIENLTKDIAESLGIKLKKGAMVSRVEPDSPASAAGVEIGDIIFRWDGKEVDGSNKLSRVVKRTKIGQPVDVQVLRGGETITLKVTTGEFKMPEGGKKGTGKGHKKGYGKDGSELVEGMELSPLTLDLRAKYKLNDDLEGVVVTRVARRTPAYRAGLREGVVISRVNQRVVDSPAEVVELIEEARDAERKSVLILVSYRGVTRHIPLRLLKEREDNDEDEGDN